MLPACLQCQAKFSSLARTVGVTQARDCCLLYDCCAVNNDATGLEKFLQDMQDTGSMLSQQLGAVLCAPTWQQKQSGLSSLLRMLTVCQHMHVRCLSRF
jgi:hypothetical protein